MVASSELGGCFFRFFKVRSGKFSMQCSLRAAHKVRMDGEKRATWAKATRLAGFVFWLMAFSAR